MTITYKEGDSFNDKCGHSYKIVTGSFAFDSSYPTNGEAMDLSKKIPTDLHLVLLENQAGYSFSYDYANKKVKAFWADYSTATDAALIEVANTTDLSALTAVRFVAIGK